MAVRGPTGPGPMVTAKVQGTVNNLARALSQAGLLAPGQDAKSLARHIIGNLRAQGYGGKVGGELLKQLQTVLLAAQRSHGLKTSGKLDKATVALLRSMGVVATAATGPKGVLEAKDGFVRAAPARGKAAAPPPPAAQQKGNLAKLASLLERNFGEFGKQLGSMLRGLGEGGAALGKAVQQALDGARDALGGAAARLTGNVPGQAEAATAALPAARADASASAAASAAAAANAAATKTSEQVRTQTVNATKDPTMRGKQVGDALSDEGRGNKQGQGTGLIGEGDGEEGLDSEGADEGGLSDQDDDEASERDRGNATSGDEEITDLERGHATLDDGSEADAGHYEVPSFASQLTEALSKIQKEPESATKATTYSWDIMLYKPGIYGAGQKGEELIHLEVREATPFDPIWEKARKEIARILRRYEPDSVPPSQADIQVALRRARVAD